VAVVGAGPVGLAAVLAVQFFSPAEVIVVDIDPHRLALAKQIGATVTINNKNNDAVAQILALTNGRGVDVAIEAAGHPLTCKVVQSIVGVGGRIANIGVYSQSAELHKQSLWVKNITIRMGVVNTTTIPLLIRTILSGKLDPSQLITHRFPFANILLAYDVFANAGKEHAVKIVLNLDASTGDDFVGVQMYGEDELVDLIVKQVMAQAK
jgi:alcohol dehydrogenase